MVLQVISQNVKIEDELPNVLILGPPSVFNYYEQQFSEKYSLLKPWESSLPLKQYLITNADSVQAVFGSANHPVNTDILQMLPELRLIATSSAGVDHVDLGECKRLGINVTNAASAFSEDVADSAVGLLLDVLRKISAADRFVKAGLWHQKGDYYLLGNKLGGKQVGIVGMGSIGLNVAKRLHAFGCIISYTSRNKKPHVTYPFYADIHQLASLCDILVICCALTDQTRYMIDKNVMIALGKGGVIVNVARGAVVVETDLIQCLLKEEIAGAGLDVFENEPKIPAELLELDNVVLSPHNAAMTEESFNSIYELTVRNLDAFFSNKPLMNVVV